MSGIEKEIDNLGRVVLPINFRHKLGLQSKDKVLVSLNDSGIIISPVEKRCALCGVKLAYDEKLRLCSSCIAEIKATN